MTTGVIATPPVLQFTLNNGQLAVNGSILTQVGGVNTATYSDSGLTTPLPNPIPLNSRGEVSDASGTSRQLFLTPNQTYTFTLFDGPNGSGNQIWSQAYINGVQATGELLAPSFAAVTDQAILASYVRTAAEIAASVTPTNYAYPPGHIFRYYTAAQIAQTQAFSTSPTLDCSGAINNAVKCATGDVFFPTGIHYINAPIYIPSTANANVRLVGESRTNTQIQPMSASIADANGINALIINQANNEKFSMYRIRLTTGGIGGLSYTGISIYAVQPTTWSSTVTYNVNDVVTSAGTCYLCIASNTNQQPPNATYWTAQPAGVGACQSIFSGSMEDCWFDTGSTNTGFFKGGFDNYAVRSCTFEFQKGCFLLQGAGGAGDVIFEANVLSNCYDYFIQHYDATTANIVTVDGLHVYTHNRGYLFGAPTQPLTNCASWKIRGITLQAATTAVLGNNIGLFNLNQCVDFEVTNFSAFSTSVSNGGATSGTTSTTLNDSTQAWGVNQYVGYTLFNVTRNLGATITGNTATSLTTAGIAGQSSGDGYELVWPGSIITTLGILATQITVQNSQVRFSNGQLSGVDQGILVAGSGAVDLSFDQVDIINVNTACFRNTNTGGTPTGIVKATNCNWMNSITNVVIGTLVSGFDFILSDCRFLNAGLGGNSAFRVLAPATSGLLAIQDCIIGQNNALAVAAYYLDAAGTGTAVLMNPAFVGTPPTAIQNPTAVQQLSMGLVQVPFNAGAPVFSTAIADTFEITCTGNVTVGAPTSPVAGKKITVTIRNTSGGAITVGWNAVFKIPAGLGTPATGFSRTLGFFFDGTNWIFTFQPGADTPN